MKQGFGSQIKGKGKQSQVKEQGKGKVTELNIVTWKDISIDKDMIDVLKKYQCFPVIFKLDGEKVSCAARIRVDKKTYTSELIINPRDPLAMLMARKHKYLDKICSQVAKKIHDISPTAREQIKSVLLSRLI